MELLVEFFKGFSLQEIVTVFGIVWILTNKKLKKNDDDLREIKEDMKRLTNIIIRLDAKFEQRELWTSRPKRLGEEE